MKPTVKPNGSKRPTRTPSDAAAKGAAIGKHLSQRMAEKKALDFESDSKVTPGDGELTRISQMVEYQLTLAATIESAEAKLSELKEKMRRVQEVDLPEAMRECGFDKIPIKVLGKTVELKSDLTMSLPKTPTEFAAALGWLRDAGLGDLIERDVTVAFGLGEEKKAEKLIESLSKKGLHAQATTSVNTARVKAAVRELLAKGKDVPLETLGAYRWTKAVVS